MRSRINLLFPLLIGLFAAPSFAQSTPPPTVIRTETKVVLVDVVVTDKKNNYVHDLSQKDFKVWEDDKQQSVTSFSFEADPKNPENDQKRYLVLFFDNSSMQLADQQRAREAARKFADANAGPNHLMAVANFSGMLQMAQNFTADADRVKDAIGNLKMSMGPGGSYGVRNAVLALQTMAKGLSDVPGRKILVFFSGGMRLNEETRTELNAAILECNHSNVAVYPVDVRGLFTNAPGMGAPGTGMPGIGSPGRGRGPGGGGAMLNLFGGARLMTASFFEPQRSGGGGGAGAGGAGGTGGGSGGGARGGSGGSGGMGGGSGTVGRGGSSGNAGGPGGRAGTGSGVNTGAGAGSRGGFGGGGGGAIPRTMRNMPYSNMRTIIPPPPPFVGMDQNALYMLADGTGGMVLLNSNDLLGSLMKIGKEQNEYYLLGYNPPDSAEGSCHNLRVKVDKGGVTVRARTGYCNVHTANPLDGKPIEKTLETEVLGTEPGKLSAPLQLPYFYTSANTARVNIAMEIPVSTVKFEKVKGKHHAEINILGIAYKADGSVAARFTDTVKEDFEDKKDMEEFLDKPMHYDNQFDIACGKYTFKVAFNAGSEYGKLEKPLDIDPYDGKEVAISSVALSKETRRATEADSALDAILLEGRTPLVASGMQIVPTGVDSFKKTDTAVTYMEVYEPENIEKDPPKLGVQLVITDKKTGQVQGNSGLLELTQLEQHGNPVVPIGLKLPVAQLPSGSYRAEYVAKDDRGRTAKRTVDFVVE